MMFQIYTLGCKVNQYDSARLEAFLLSRGFLLSEKNADLIIINTCAVTASAIFKGDRLLKQLKKIHPKAETVAIGCRLKAGQDGEMATDINISEKKEELIFSQIAKLFKLDFCSREKLSGIFPLGERNRYFLKIQDGCWQFCSYCLIPYVRGDLYSKPVEDVVS